MGKRVLHLVETLEPCGNTGRMAFLWNKDSRVVSFSPISEAMRKRFPDAEERIRRFPRDPFVWGRLLRLCRHWKPDVIHVWDDRNLEIAVRCAAFCGAKTVATLRHIDPWRKPLRKFFPKMDFLVTHLSVIQQQYESVGCHGNWRVIPDGVEDWGLSVRENPLFSVQNPVVHPEKPLWVACVGPAETWKRWKWAIWSIDSIVRLYPNARLWFLGDRHSENFLDPLFLRLQTFARQYEREDIVRFGGMRENLREILPQCSLFWSPQSVPGGGMAILEAMAAGVPVVTTRTEGIHQLIPEGFAEFVPVEGETLAIAAASHRILSHREEMLERAQRAQAWVLEHFSVERLRQNNDALWEETIPRKA